MQTCQQDIVNKDSNISKALVKLETLHITLFAMYLEDQGSLERFKSNLSWNIIFKIKIIDSILQYQRKAQFEQGTHNFKPNKSIGINIRRPCHISKFSCLHRFDQKRMLWQTSRFARQKHSLMNMSIYFYNHIKFLGFLVSLFESWGISLSEKKFTPHMTLMKLSKSAHFHRQGKAELSRAWNTNSPAPLRRLSSYKPVCILCRH